MHIQHYMNERVESQIIYYDNKSAENKKYYHLFKTMQMVAAALLPFFSVFISDYLWMKYIVAFLGTMVTILEGVLSIGKYHEKWVTYRSTAEALRQEKFMFIMQTGNYADADAQQQFVSKIEALLGKENAGWQQIIIREKNSDQKNGSRSKEESSESFSVAKESQPRYTRTSTENGQDAPIDPLTGVVNDPEQITDTHK